MTTEIGEEKARRGAAAWVKHRDWLASYFQDQADEYAHEMSRVGEGGKLETERSPHEIKREMESLNAIEELIRVIRGLVVAVVVVVAWLWLVVPGFWLPPFVESDTTLAGWARVAWMVLSWVLAAVIGHKRFWKNYLNVLRQTRMQRFWEWRSATLRFPVRSIVDSGLSDRSELHAEASEPQTKPPYLLN